MALSFCPPGVFAAFVDSVIERVSVLQGHLQDLDNPRWNYIFSAFVLVSANLTIFCIRFLLIPYCHSSDCLIVIFVILCVVYATALYLIKPGIRLPCLFPLLAWVCARLLVFRQLLFLGAVLALRNCVINYWLHSMILLFLFPPFLEENQVPLGIRYLCYLGITLHQSTTHPKLRVFFNILWVSVISLLNSCTLRDRLELGASLITPLLVLGCGPFLLNHWA